MTDEAYRGRGLARQLISRILDDFRECDGVYLFGNMNALDFYRKQGFFEMTQYKYSVRPEFCRSRADDSFEPASPELLKKYTVAVRNGAVNSSLEQINKFGLQMFYTADMSDVFYCGDIDCFVVSERSGGTVELKSVISTRRIALSEIVDRISAERINLGFTPCREDLYICSSEPYNGADDYRLFCKGASMRSVEEHKLYFPELSHA